MREPWEMYTASRMQNMVQIRAWNAYFVTKRFVAFVFSFQIQDHFNNILEPFWIRFRTILGPPMPKNIFFNQK